MDCVQHIVGKFAAKYGADLDDLLGRPQPIQPRHQRVMQRRRDLARRKLPIAALEHRPRQLLDEQRHATGTLDHQRDGLLRQCLLRRHLGHHRAHVT